MSEIPPDDKDWTWVLERPCPDCGFDAQQVTGADVPGLTRAYAARWADVLARPDVRRRPEPTVWSALEYGAHVRDVCRVMAERARLMLTEDRPTFDSWDQDATAVLDGYGQQDPGVVVAELAEAAEEAAARFTGVDDEAWGRPGLRSNGSRFTVLSLGRYFLHDVHHHLHDVGG